VTPAESFQIVTDASKALTHPVTRGLLIAIAGAFVLAPAMLLGLQAIGKLSAKTKADAWTRYRTWLWIAPLVIAPCGRSWAQCS
jgi:hypothetical protein